MKMVLVLFMLLSCLAAGAPLTCCAAGETNWYVKITPADFKAALKELGSDLSYDVAGVNLERRTIDLVVTEDQYRELQGVYDVQVLASPEDLNRDRPDAQYMDVGEIDEAVHQYNEDYPAITRLISIGTTEEGRNIWAIKISDSALFDEDEPVVLFNAQHHAREVMTSEITMDIVDYLCTRYATDPVVHTWVDSLEIWVVPMLNLDGVNYVFNSYTLWRKDRHDNNAPLCPGIDPNRDYDSFFGACFGSSGWACMETYRGAYPEDSGCVANICAFARQIRPLLDISYHSYSELVIYPYGCDGDYTPDQEAVADVGDTMASLIQTDSGAMGYTSGTGWEILYATDGGDIDWYYQEFGTFAYVIEINADMQGFQPDYDNWRDSTVQRLRASWQYMLNRVQGPGVTGIVRDANTNLPIQGATVAIQEIPLTTVEAPRITDNFGRYFRVLLPGTYHFTVGAIGYPTVTVPVTVGSTLVNLDILLTPGGATRTPTVSPTFDPNTPTFTFTQTLTPTRAPNTPTRTPTPSPDTPTDTPTPYHSPTPWTPEPTIPPTATATPEASLTPTEVPADFWSQLLLNDTTFETGERFFLQVEVQNGTAIDYQLDRYIVLDAFGLYFYHPDWGQDIDSVQLFFEAGYTGADDILDFTWPAGAGSADGLAFWLAFLDPETMSLVGEVDTVQFGYR